MPDPRPPSFPDTRRFGGPRRSLDRPFDLSTYLGRAPYHSSVAPDSNDSRATEANPGLEHAMLTHSAAAMPKDHRADKLTTG